MKRRVTAGRRNRRPASSKIASADAAAERAIEKEDRQYAEALRNRDIETLDRVWASDYTFVNPRGELLTKAQRIANIKSGASEFQTMSPQKERLNVHGALAVEVGRVIVQGEYSGRESSGEYRYTTTWTKVGGRWQILANQITLIAK